MKHSLRSLARAAVALALLALLPAVHAASFTDSAPTLTVDLAASDSVSIASAGTTYSLTLAAGNWTGTDTANVTGTGTATLTVTATGLANFTLIDITDSGTGASVTFADSGANAYSDNFTITLDATAAATALTFNGASSFGANALTVSVDNTISVAASANVAATGTGTISLTTTRNITVGSSATVSTADGNLTLSANAAGTTVGNFVGVEIFGLVQATGSGNVNVTGWGGNDASGAQHGVRVRSGGDILGGTSGTVTVTGTGGASAGNNSYGAYVTGAGSSIGSGGANVQIIGQGGGSGASVGNYGAIAENTGLITAGGSGTVTVQGTGGTGSGGTQIGVYVVTGGDITGSASGTVTVQGTGGASSGNSSYGVLVESAGSTVSSGVSVQITGNGGGSGSGIQNIGVLVRTSGAISATGTGTVSITGNGGTTTTGDQNHGVAILSTVSANNGTITINGTGGGTGASGINRGIQIGGSTENASVAAAGANTVSLTGTGGSGGSSTGNNQGVMVLTSASQTTSVTSAGGNMTFNGTPGGSTTHGIDISGGGTSTSITTGGGNLTLIADGMSLSSTALSLNTGAGSATLRQKNNGTAINLGAADAAGTLGLTDTELDYFTATTVNIGDANSGAVTVSVAITHGNNLSISVASAITINQAVTMALDKNLTAATTGTSASISLPNGTSDLTATGTGAISLTTVRNIFIGSGAGVTTVNGNLTLSANAGGTTTGAFVGVDVSNGLVQASGTGVVSVTGKGGDGAGGSNYGVLVQGGGDIIGGNTPANAVTVTGTGGPSSGNANHGICVTGSGSTITSGGANASVTGTGGGSGASANNRGVQVDNSGQVTAGGTATVTVAGNGGTGSTGNDNYGVLVDNTGSFITSTGGAVSVTGTGGGSGTSGFNYGVLVRSDGNITAGGATSTLDITGNGGTGSGGNHLGISLETSGSQIASSGGNLTLTGTGGVGGSEVGIRLDAGTTVSTPAGGGSITLIADKMQLGASGTIVTDNGNGGVTLRQKTAATVAINLGSAVDTTASTLELSDTELDRISATTINIGNASSGAVTVSAAMTLDDNVSLTSGGTITFNNTFDLSGVTKSLTVDSVGTITINTTAISTTGTQTYQDAVSLTAGPTITASTVTFNSTVDGGQALVITGNAVFNDDVGLGTSLTSLSVSLATTINVASAGNDVQTTGAQTYTGAVTLSATTAVASTGAGNITFASTVSGGGNALTVNTTGITSFQGAVSAASVITDAGGTTRIDTASISATAASGRLELNDAVIVAVDTTLTSNGTTPGVSTVRFFSTVNSDTGVNRNLTVTTTSANATVQFDGAVGAVDRLNVVTINNAGTFATLAAADFLLEGAFSQAGAGAVNTLNGDITTTGDNISFSGAVTLGANVALSTGAGAGDITFNSTLDEDGGGSTRNLTLTAGTGNVTFTGAVGTTVDPASITVNSATTVTASADLGVATTLAITATDINFNGGVSGTCSVTLTPSGTATFATGTTSAFSGSLTLASGTTRLAGTANLSNAGGFLTVQSGATLDGTGTTAKQIDLSSGGFVAPGTSTTTGVLNAANLNFAAGGTFDIEVNGTTVGTQHDQLTASGTVTLNTPTLNVSGTISSSPGQVVTILNKTSGGAIAGTFNGLAEGAYVSFNGITFTISYVGGTGNDVTLTEATQTQVTLAGGTVTVSDAIGTADNLTIVLNGANVRISDSTKILSAGAGVTQIDPNTIEVPVASITGSIDVNGNDGADTLTRNFAGGNILRPINFSGGNPVVAVGDLLVVTGGGTFATVTHTFTSASDGSVAVTGNGLISYTGLEPVTDNLSATDRVFDFTGGAETITLTDNVAADGNMRIDSTLGELVDFANPTTSLTINAGTGDDQITITSVDAGFTGALTINGDANTDNITITAIAPTISALTTTSETLAALPTLSIGAGGLSLTTSAGAISQAGATTLTVTGTATLAAGAANNITLANVGNNFSTVVVTSGNDVSLRDAGAINLGTSTVSGSLTVNAAGLIDFTGAGASTVGTTMGLTTTAGGITDSGGGTLAVTGVATLAAGAANNITLDNNNNFTTVAVTSGNNVTLNDTVANLTLNASTVSGTLTVNVTTLNASLTVGGAVTYGGTVTFVADNMAINNNVTSGGTGTVNLRQNTAGTLINLGAADAAGTLGLVDAEIDRFNGGGVETINIGNTSSGAVTVSDTIARATTANLVITTAANNNIAFSGGTASLNANAGNVTLTTTGTGAITSGGAATEIAGATVSLNAGSGGIGASGNPITLNATTLNTLSASADQYLSEQDTVTMNTLDAGAGFDIHLTGGQFSVAAAGATVVTGDIFVDAGSLNQIASGRVVEGGPGGTLTIGATGTVVIHQTGATPYNTMFDGRAAPTLVSGSTINWQSTAATTVDLTTFENVNFNGAGPFALSGNTTVTTAGNTMTVSTGSRLNTGAFFVDGAGNFTLQSNGTLGIGSAAGITSAGATGSIQVTGTRSFNASGDYVYNGVALQVTGNGLPVTITTPGSLTINNASNVELTQDTTTDLLVLTSGRFFTENGGGDRLLTTTAPISGGGAGSYVVGRLARSFIVGAQEHVFHIGDAANYAPFDVGFGAGSFTVTAGGTLTARVFPDYGGSTAALHPNLTAGGQPIAGLESTDTILRYWRLTPSGGLAGSYYPAATYANADIQGDETRYVLRRYNDDGLGTMWHLTPNNNRTPGINTVFVDPAGATPVTLFGDYTVGEQKISFYTLSHPNSVGEELNVNFGLTVTPRDYLGGAVLSGHESVTLTYNAYYANSATATANFTFNGSASPYSGAGAFTTGSQVVTGQGTVRETLDIVVMDGSSRTGILEDLIIGNAPTAALAGTAVRMTGTGYGLTDNLGPEFTDESITVEMWFNVDATGTGGVLFDERGAANTLGYRASWIEAVGPVGGPYEIRLRVWNIPQAINGNNPRTTGLAIGTVTAGGWHHVTLRYDKALLRLDGFLDGVKSASFITGDRTTPFEVNASNPVVREGIFFGIGLADDQHLGNGLGFKGDLDELRIWDGARSDAQILDNWTKTVDPASTGLVAYYHFDDGSGTVAQDATANGYDLAFVNLTPAWVSSTALSGVAALTYDVEVGETVVITLDGFDPEDTGTLTANVGAVTGSWGVNANLRQYDNTLINAGGVAVTDSARRVKVQGLVGGGPLTFQYTVNNGIANSPAITVTVNVVGATGAPTINASGTVAPASNEDTSPVTITRAQIAAALAAADPAPGPGATIAFRVRSLVNGKLQINGTNVVDNSTFITGTVPLNSVTWYPPANVSGIVDAFIVDAYDGSTPTDGQYSANTGIVRVNLTALNDAPITQVVTTALDFDGTDDYLFTPNLRSAFSNETVTLEVWFRPSTNASGQIVPGAIISERGQNSTNGWRNTTLELLPSGQVKARMWNITAINLGTVDTNNWNHAVVRYDKSTLKVTGFLNRVASSTLAGGVGNGDRKAPWEDGRFALHYDIGAPNDQNLGSGAPFKGQVAEFRIWTIARTDAAIRGSYLGADLTNERGLLAWYKLDEAVGPAAATTPDDSVNNHDATLFGTPQFVNVHPMIAVAGSYVIKLPAIDVEDETMTWVVNTTAAQLNGGKLYHNLGGAVGAEIPTDAAIALFPVANGTVYYVPPSGGPADHDIYFYVADASGAVSTTASVKISVTAALRRAGDYAGGGAGDGAALSYAGGSGAGMGAGGSGASGGGSGGASGFSAASLVQVVTPADGSGWASSDTATVIIAVSPLLGQAAFVEVFADGESLGLAVPGEAGIWALSVNGVPPGTYQLRAVAVDSVGTAILSLPVTVTVSP